MESQSLSPVELHVVLVPLDTVQLVSPQAEVTNQPEAVSHLQDRQFSSRVSNHDLYDICLHVIDIIKTVFSLHLSIPVS